MKFFWSNAWPPILGGSYFRPVPVHFPPIEKPGMEVTSVYQMYFTCCSHEGAKSQSFTRGRGAV